MPSLNRRQFMQATAATAVLAGANRADAANDRLRAGIIGCGNIANNHVGAMMRLEEEDNIRIDTLCDVNPVRMERYQERIESRGGKVKTTGDYRRMLDDKDIDYVVVCTPEHSHFRIVRDALQAGKHVYCEKPLCYDVTETKAIVALAEETGLQLQVGVQGASDDSYPSALEAIRAGKLGPVVQAQIEFNRNHKIDMGPWRKDLSAEPNPPEDLDWDEWLAPRPQRPYDPHLYHEWRCYSEFSGGIATDLFVHRITRIILACGLDYPQRAAALGGIRMWDDGRDTPDNLEMLLEYPAVDGVTPGMTVHLLGTMSNEYRIDHCIRGHKATLIFTRSGWEIIDGRSREVLETYEKETGEDMQAHHRNHHTAIREGAALKCPPELGLKGVVAARMGNLSWERKQMVAWDEADHKIVLS